MHERRWRHPRIAWVGGAMVLSAVFKTTLTVGLGLPFDPFLVTSVVVVALAGAVLYAVGTESVAARNGTGQMADRRAINPTAVAVLLGLIGLILFAAVVTHVATFVPGAEPSLDWMWPVPLAAGIAPFVAGLAWVIAYHAIRERTIRAPDRLRAVMIGEFWSDRTVGPVLLTFVYAIVISLATRPTTGDAQPIPRGNEYVVLIAGGEQVLTADERRAADAYTVRVRTGPAIAGSLWGVLAVRRLRRFAKPSVAAGEPRLDCSK